MRRRSDDLLRNGTTRGGRGGSPPAWWLGSWHLERAHSQHNRTAPDHQLHMPLGSPGVLQGPGICCDPRATWLRRESACWLYCTPTSLALIVTYLALHKTHLAARAAPSRPRSTPRWSTDAEGSPSFAFSSVCRRSQTPVRGDLWRKGARKGERMRCDEVGAGSTHNS